MDEFESMGPIEETRIPEDNGGSSGEEDERRQRNEFMVNDAREFSRKHPEVSIDSLENNTAFLRFCGSRFGKEPLASLYEDFHALADDTMRAARDSVESKARCSNSSGGSERRLTAAQKRELNEWNKAYPKLKMSEQEFLSR